MLKQEARRIAPPEAGDHLGETDHFLDAVADEIGQVGQHGEAGVFIPGLGAHHAVLTHGEETAELFIHRLCRQTDKQTEK